MRSIWWGFRGDPVRGAGCEGEIPQFLTSTAIGQEEFEAALTAPAGSHDDHRDALELDFAELEEADLVDDVADQVTNEILGFGSLDCEGETSGSRTVTSKPFAPATAWQNKVTSLSASTATTGPRGSALRSGR